jgi:N-dimethylarginine dimethylaminohydrolase
MLVGRNAQLQRIGAMQERGRVVRIRRRGDVDAALAKEMEAKFWKTLQDRGIRLVEVPEEEFPSMGPNVLALAPRKCLMLEGNPVTQRRLEEAGCEVLTYRGRQISLKAEGGPTCLTRPVWRS